MPASPLADALARLREESARAEEHLAALDRRAGRRTRQARGRGPGRRKPEAPASTTSPTKENTR